jgi:hypothetical protein
VSATGSEMPLYPTVITIVPTTIPSVHLPVPVASSEAASLIPVLPLESTGLVSSTALPSFSFPNSTSSFGYGVPASRVARDVKTSESPEAPSTGAAHMQSVSLAALFLSLLAAIYSS